MHDPAAFGRWLKQHRTRWNLTQQQLARRVSCAPETVRKLEAGGRRASKALAQRLADALMLGGAERAEFLRLARAQPVVASAPTGEVVGAREAEQADTPEPMPLLATKLYRPRPRVELVVRTRLHDRLTAGRRSPLTLIAAPAGFGKTTLLAEWLDDATTGQPVAWLALDGGDSDPLTFLRYVIAALQSIAPALGAAVLPLLRSAQPPALEAALPVLANDLAALPEGSVLVLDDYHVVESPAVHQALQFLLEHLPPQLHVVISSRADPPFPLARWRARGQLTEVRAQDLRFTIEEAAAFLQQVMGLPLTPADVAAVEARTEGWIAGLQLAALSLQDRRPDELSAFIDTFTGSHRFVVDYLIDEVLARQPPDVQSFLLQTSILERLGGPLCDAVVRPHTGEPALDEQRRNGSTSQALLEYLERSNLFIVALDDERRWYRYHQLFAQVLQERLTSSAPDGATASLHNRAAGWYEQHGLIAQAIHHAFAAHDPQHAARLLEHSVEPMWMRGELQRIHRWLDALPRDVLRTAPRLLLAAAWSQFLVEPFQTDAVESLLHEAEAVLQQGTADDAPEHAALRGRVAAIRASVASSQEAVPQTIAHAQQALAVVPQSDVFWRIIPAVNLGLAYDVAGDVAAAGRAFAEASDLCQTAGNAYTGMVATMHLARVQATQGRLHAAADLFRHVVAQAAQQGWMHLPMVGLPYVWLGKLLYEWNDLDGATQRLLDGIRVVRPREHQRILLEGYAALARVKQAQGDASGARDMLQQANEVAQTTAMPWAALLAAAYGARVALAQGDVARATDLVEIARRRANDAATAQAEVVQLVLARVLMAQGKPGAAQPILEHYLRAADVAGRLANVVEILVLQAAALQLDGQSTLALTVLGRALSLAEPEGYMRTFMDEGAPMAALLAAALERPTWGALEDRRDSDVRRYASQALAAIRAESRASVVTSHIAHSVPDAAQPLDEPLTERERDVLRLLAAGRSNAAIAAELIVAVGTVKRHVNSIMSKLQAESRLAAVVRARALGLV